MSPFSEAQLVIFDIDGTLVDHLGAQQAGLAKLYGMLEEAQRVPVLLDHALHIILNGSTGYNSKLRLSVHGLSINVIFRLAVLFQPAFFLIR